VLYVASIAGVAITCTRRSLLHVTIVLKGANLILLIMLVCQLIQSEGPSSYFRFGVLMDRPHTGVGWGP
jgi:hypothetical protein